MTLPKRNYIDISRKNQKGIIDSDTSRSNFIFNQNEIANKNAEGLAQLKREADFAKQAREIELKRREMELLVAKQKAAELKKQKEEERKLQEDKLALVKQEQEAYLKKDIKQTDPVIYQEELKAKAQMAGQMKQNPSYQNKKAELDKLLLEQKTENEKLTVKPLENKIKNFEDDPESFIGERIVNKPLNFVYGIYNTLYSGAKAITDTAINTVYKDSKQEKINKLQNDLKIFEKPELDLKYNEIEKIKQQKVALYKTETNLLKKHQLEVEIWKDEQSQKEIKNTINPSNMYVVGSLVEAIAGTTDFDKDKSVGSKLNSVHLFPRMQVNLSEWYSRRDLEDKYQDVLVEKPGETPEQRKARLDTIPEEDLNLLKSYSIRDEAKGMVEPFQSFGARQATQMESSLDMVALMIATEGMGSAIGGVSGRLIGSTRAGKLAERAAIDAGETATTAKAIGAETASVSPKAFLEKGYIDQVEKNLLAKGTNKYLAKTAAVALDGTQLAAKVQAMNSINPNFVNENLSKGSYVDRDENGEIKSIYVQDKYYDLMKKMTFGYDTPDGQHIDGEKDSYVKRAAVLRRTQNRTEKEEEELDQIEQKLGWRTSLSEKTFEEDLEMYKPMSKAGAYAKGFRQNLIETATEVYTGPLLGIAGKGLTKLPGVGKYAIKAEEKYKKLGSAITTGKANVINSNKVLKYLDKNMTKINMPTFSGKTITGNTEEFVEEWVGSAANSLIDGDPKEFMDTTFDAQSNTDIGLQTAFMNLGFGAMSVTSTNAKLQANRISARSLTKNVERQNQLQKQYENAIEENKKEIANQKEALKDESLTKEDKAVKTKLIEDLETQNVNSAGAITKIQKKAQTGKAYYQDLRDYTDARNQIREINNTLRTAHLDSDINKVMNLASMSSTDLQAQKDQIDILRKEGSDKAADLAEKILFNNVINTAVQTGTLKDLKSSLEAASAKGTLSPGTQQSLLRAMKNVAHLEEVSEKYQKHPYLNKILGMESEAFNLSEEIETAKRNTNNISTKAVEAIQQMYPNREFNINTIYDDTDSTFSEVELKQMKESNDAIDNHKTAYDIQNKFQEQLVKTNKVISVFKNEAKQEVNKKNVNIDIRKQLADIQAAKDNGTDVNDASMYVYENTILENERIKFDDKGKLIIDKELIDYLFENNENNYVGDWKTSSKISKESFDNLKDNYYKRVDMIESFKKVQDLQSEEIQPENTEVQTPEFSEETATDTEIQTPSTERIPVNNKKYKSAETAAVALKQLEKPRKVKKGTHEVVQVEDYFILSKKIEEISDEETPLELEDNGTIQVVNTEEEQEGFVAIEENYNEAMSDLLDELFNEDVSFDLSIDNNEYRFTAQQMALAKAYLEDYYNEMARKVEKKDITFEKLFEQMFHYGNNKKAVEVLFPALAIAWKNEGNEFTTAQQANLYNKYYGKGIDRGAVEEAFLESFNNIYAETVVIAPVETSLPEIPEIISSESTTNYNDTVELEEEIQAALEADKQMSDKERQSITPKAAFSSVKYTTYIDENGDVHRVSTATNFRDTNGVNFKELLDYDKYYTGYQAGVRVSTEEEWAGLSISNGRDAEGNVNLIPFLTWLSEKEAANPNFKNTQEFTDRVPMFLLNEQGEKVSYLNDVAWYDTVNVYNPYGSSVNQNNPSDMWQRHINKGIENVRELRNNVKNGLDKVTIERNSEEGIYLKLKKEAGQPTISISESNPQANIAVATSTSVNGLEYNNKELSQKIKNGSAVFLNKPSEIILGHTYYISRIGTTVLPNGKKVETYRAFEVLREVSENQVETVRNVYEMFKKYTWAVKNNNIAQVQELTKNFIKPILVVTGIDISKGFEKNGSIVYTGITDFIKMYFQADKKALQEVGVNSSDIHFAYERLFNKYSNAELAREANQLLSQHTSKTALKAKQMIEVDKDGRVTLLEKEGTPVSYEEYVKDNVKTNIKSLNIGTAEEPKYITVIQPIINIIGKPVAQAETQTSEKIAETTKRIVEEIKATTQNNSNQTEKNLSEKEKKDIETFFNKLNINIDYEEIDEAIDNLDAIDKLFNTSGNLDFKQEYAVKQFFIGKMTRYLIDNKVDISKPITNEVKKQIFDVLKTEVDKIVQDRTAEVNIVKENLKTFTEDNTVKKINEIVNSTLENLKTLTEEYEALFNKSFDKLKIDSKVIEEEEDNSNVGIEDKNYSKESIETDLKKGVTPNLRLFLNSISQYNKQGGKVTTYLGLDSYMEFNEIFNQLIKNIAIGIDIPSDYNILIETLQNSKAPFIKDVLEKLENADEQVKNTFLTTFVKHSLNSKSAQYSKINNATKLKILENDSNEGKRVVKKEYLNSLKTSIVYNQDGTVNTNSVNDLIKRYESLFKEYPNLITLEGENKEKAESEIRMLLEQSGLIMQDATWNDILNEKFYNKGYKTLNDLYTLDNGGLLKPMLTFLKGLKKEDVYDNEKNILSNLGGVTNAIIKLEVANDTNLNSTSFRDSGKNISKLVPTKYITDKVMDLKRSVTDKNNNLIDNLQDLSFSKDSVILQLLSEHPEFQSIFSISHVGLEAMKEAGKPVYGKSGITDVSDLDYFLATFTGFQDRRSEKLIGATIDSFPIRIANMLNLTMSDKSTNTYLQTGVFDFMASPLSFTSNEAGDMAISQEVKNLMIKQLVKPELERIANFHNTVKATNISDYDKAAKIFHLVPALNNIKDAKGIRLVDKMAMMDNISPDLLLAEYNQQFSEIISQVVEEEVNHFKEIAGDKLIEMFDSEYFTEINSSKDTTKALYDFVLNSMIHQADLFKVFAGDISNYAKDKQVTETGLDNKTTDQQYISLNKQIGVNLGKRLALLIAPGNKIANSYNEKYHQIFLQDSVDISENARYLMDLYYPETDKIESYAALEKYDEIAENINRYEQGLVEISPEVLVKYKDEQSKIRESLQKQFPSIEDYFDIESTDAQEYTTAKEHVNILFKLGRLNVEQYKRIMNNIESDIQLSKEDLKFVLQPIKPVHTGTYYNEKWDVNRVVYIKTSSFPLLKQFTGPTKLNALRIKMEELEAKTGNGVRASYKTGNKVGAVKSNNEVNPFDVQSLENIFNGFDATTNTFDENGMNNSVLTLDRNNFRIQQDVPFKSDKKKVDTVAMSTQFFKMLFGDGVVENYTEKERDAFATFSLDGKMVTGKELYNHYTKTFEKLMDTKKQQLFRELEMSPEGQITNKLAFTQKLQALLVKEAVEKGYSLKSVRGLTIEKLQAELGYHYDFKTPLWLSTDSNRYEALLNSLVTNRILQHKIPGNSYVAGSESGFRMKEGLEGIDQSKIIYLNNYNGKELQGTHTTTEEAGIVFHKAQVFVPSKFKTSKNELIDLFEGYNETSGSVDNAKYLKRNENGSLGLKENMIDKELLNLFSFRTPTSSHVSGASIEIAGFLPSIQGDLMIVPKNFTKQKGLDYDVDKEGTYMLNHLTNKDGKIEVLTQKHKYNSLKTLKSLLADENNIYKSDIGLPGMDYFYEEIRKAFGDDFVSEMQNEGANLENKIKSIELEYDKKLAENEFIKTHLAVYNNPSAKIQQKINKVLSISVAKEQAQQLEKDNTLKEKAKFISERELKGISKEQALAQYESRQKSFTMLSYIYQKDKMNFGAIGKTAIGVYANATTLSSLMQQNENQVSLVDNGLIQIGDLIFDGKFGKIYTLNSSRTIADVLAERENIATDNEKEQVLTKVGINAETINVDALLTLAGFDTVEYIDKITNKSQTISLPFYLLSQPAITDFNNSIKNSKGVLGGYLDKNKLIDNTILNLSGKRISYAKQGDGTYMFVNKKDGTAITDFNGKILTPENLVNGVKSNGQNLGVQTAAFMTFINLNEKAKVLQKAQSVINTNDLGKSMVGSKLKYERLKTISENGVFNNIEKLLGDFIKKDSVSEKPQGYYDTGEYYIKPTTPQGQIVINGLHIGNNIFKDFFPFQSEALNDTVKEIVENSGKAFTDVSEEEYEEVIDELKKYIFSNKNNNIFNGETDAVRFDLFKDTDSHKSLSTYVHSLVYNKENTKALRSIKENALLKQLSFNLNFDSNTLSTISFNNSDSGTNNQENLYNAVPELIKNNYKLPDRNGMPYNTRMLATDLIAYAYLEGGVQEATQFVKVIPVEVLETIGNYKDVKQADGSVKKVFVTANAQLQKYNPSKYNKTNTDPFGKILGVNETNVADFTRQYFQHNSNKAKKVPRKQVVFDPNDTSETPQMFSFNPKFLDGNPLAFLRLGESLYEHKGNLNYYKINTIGGRGISEYKYGEKEVVNFDVKQKEIIENDIPGNINQIYDATLDFEGVTNINDALAKIQNLSLAKEYEFLKTATQFFSQFQDNTTKFEIDSNSSAAGSFYSVANKVTLHNSTLTDSNKAAMTLVHEYIHSITSREIMNYYQADGVTLKEGVSIPSYVQDLHEVFSKFREQFATEIAEITDKKQGLNKDNFTEDEKNIYYAGYNIKEFMAVALTSVDFQNEMNKVAYPGTSKNFIEKILETIMKIVDTIYPELKKDTVAYEAISKSMRFIAEEQGNKKASKTIKLLTGEDLSLVNLAGNQIGLGQIDTSKEVMNQKGSIEVPLNERVSQKLPATLQLEENISVDTKTLMELSQLKEAGMYGESFNWSKYDDDNKEELTTEEVEELFKKEYGPAAFEYAQDKWQEGDVAIAELEFLRDNPIEGLKIVTAWYNLSDSDFMNDDIISHFADRIIKGVPKEYIDKNQMKLFSNETKIEDLRQEEQQELKIAFPSAVETNGKIEKSSLTTKEDKAKFDKIYDKFDKLITPLLEQENKDEMISNNLITFDSSIETLGITKEEWDTLSQEEQERIKKCN